MTDEVYKIGTTAKFIDNITSISGFELRTQKYDEGFGRSVHILNPKEGIWTLVGIIEAGAKNGTPAIYSEAVELWEHSINPGMGLYRFRNQCRNCFTDFQDEPKQLVLKDSYLEII